MTTNQFLIASCLMTFPASCYLCLVLLPAKYTARPPILLLTVLMVFTTLESFATGLWLFVHWTQW